MGDAVSFFQMLTSLEQKLQILVVCGHNDKLRQVAEDALKDSKHRSIITGYIDYVHEFMAVSDLIVTKPGGVTISEAMTAGLPMVLYHALPGQEQDNATFLKKAGVAMQAETLEDLQLLLSELSSNPLAYLAVKKNVETYKWKPSALDALHAILQLSQQEKGLIPTIV